MARSRGGFGRRTAKRLTSWDIGVGDASRTVVGSTTPQFLGSALSPIIPGLTLVRTRGSLLISLATVTTARDGLVGAVGIGIASAAAVAAGITSVPTPFTEQSSENWIWWQAFAVTLPQVGTDAATGLGAGTQAATVRVEIDSKAMRKFEIDQSLYAAIEVGTEVGVASADVFLNTRMLFKLP